MALLRCCCALEMADDRRSLHFDQPEPDLSAEGGFLPSHNLSAAGQRCAAASPSPRKLRGQGHVPNRSTPPRSSHADAHNGRQDEATRSRQRPPQSRRGRHGRGNQRGKPTLYRRTSDELPVAPSPARRGSRTRMRGWCPGSWSELAELGVVRSKVGYSHPCAFFLHPYSLHSRSACGCARAWERWHSFLVPRHFQYR